MDEVTYHNDNLIEIRDSYSSINHQSVVIVINLERPLFRAFVTKKKRFCTHIHGHVEIICGKKDKSTHIN